MSLQSFQIPSCSDRKTIEVFSKLATLMGVQKFTGTTFGHANFSSGPGVADDEVCNRILEKDGMLIDRVAIGVPGLNISFIRGGNDGQDGRIKSAIWDAIQINGDHQYPAEKKIEAVALVISEFRPYTPDRNPTVRDLQTSGELIAIHSSILEKLEHTNANLVEQTTDLQRQLHRDAEALIADERQKVESWRAGVELEVAERHRGLDEFKNQLDEVKKRIDDRSNTHARREARDRLLDEVKTRVEKFGVSQATESKRRSVAAGMYLLFVVLTMLLIYTVIEINQIHAAHDNSAGAIGALAVLGDKQPSNDIAMKLAAKLSEANLEPRDLTWLWLRFSLGALGLIGSIIYYIRWQDRWANQHAVSEWQLRQFQLDISRANWVIESGLEWKTETDELMHETLIERITHGLFVKDNEPAQVLHPADELASALLGSASKVNLRTAAGDLEFNKPSKVPKTSD